MPENVLPLEVGRRLGSGPSRRLRREGKVPATVYGLESDPVSVAVEYGALRGALSTEAGTNAVLHLQILGEDHLALVKEMQRHPLRRDVIHVDFLKVDPNVEVHVNVPIRLEGRAAAVEEMNGIVDQDVFELAVSAIPGSIPNNLTVDISSLTVGSSITVSDLTFPEGVECLEEASTTVVSGIITRSALMDAEAAQSADGEAPTGEEGDQGATQAG